MPWEVAFHDEFAGEFEELRADGGIWPKPLSSTLRHPQWLKALQHERVAFSMFDGEWRVAFAFDPQRCAILLVGGNKSGVSQQRFYRKLIRTADKRFDEHLDSL